MKYGFYLVAGTGLILLQTSVMPYFFVFDGIYCMYDILIPFILYLSIFCPFSESLPVIAVCGFVMDSLSAGPFGIFSTSYIWIFIGIRWIAAFIRISGAILSSALMMLGVLVENAVVFSVFGFMSKGDDLLPDNAFFMLSIQLVCAAVTGTLIIQTLKYFHITYDERGWRQSARALKQR